MGCSWGNKGCGDIKTIPGPQGPAGADGTNGTNGTNGVDGAAGPPGPAGVGGMSFEAYFNLDIDHNWGEIETVVPGTTHLVSGDGDYQVHVDTSNLVFEAGSSSSQLRLYANGILVDFMPIVAPNPPESVSPSIQKHLGMNWRGGLLSGQTIELRTVQGNTAVVNTSKVNMLINKEG